LTGARLANGVDPTRLISGIGTLAAAGPNEIAFAEGAAYAGELRVSRAGACLCQTALIGEVPA
jgi:UDP-3-O-[3-hydroxymyristoyl] glucosamine N-acyltransferase